MIFRVNRLNRIKECRLNTNNNLNTLINKSIKNSNKTHID